MMSFVQRCAITFFSRVLWDLLIEGDGWKRESRPIEWVEAMKQRLSHEFEILIRVAGEDATIRGNASEAMRLGVEFATLLGGQTSPSDASYRAAFERLSDLEYYFRDLEDCDTPAALRETYRFTLHREPDEPQMISNWPVGQGWEFRPGEGAFLGVAFAITGKPATILEILAKKPGEPVTKIALLKEIDPDCNAEESCVRDGIFSVRQILRKAFDLGKVDPVPNTARGLIAAWKLDESIIFKSR